MKKNKFYKIIFTLNLLISSFISAQESYFYRNGIHSKVELLAEMKALNKKHPNQDPYFSFNKIIERNDSIIKYGTIVFTPKGIKQENVLDLLNKQLPDFSLDKYNGEKVTNKTYAGKPIILNLWFAACEPCVKELPDLNLIKKQYDGKLSFVSITTDDKNGVAKFLTKYKFDYDILINGRNYIKSLGNYYYPKIILIDKSNKVRFINSGIPSDASWKKLELKSLIDEIEILIKE